MRRIIHGLDPLARLGRQVGAATTCRLLEDASFASSNDLWWSIEGIANAKDRGVHKGRKASIDPAKIRQMKANGIGPPTTIAKTLKIGRASAYPSLAE